MCAMAYAEFQQELKQLTAREFARLIKMNESSITNYSSKGTVPSHLAVIAKLIGTMAAHEIDFRRVIRQMRIEPKRRAAAVRFLRWKTTFQKNGESRRLSTGMRRQRHGACRSTLNRMSSHGQRDTRRPTNHPTARM